MIGYQKPRGGPLPVTGEALLESASKLAPKRTFSRSVAGGGMVFPLSGPRKKKRSGSGSALLARLNDEVGGLGSEGATRAGESGSEADRRRTGILF